MALAFAIKLTDQVSPDARKASGALQELQSMIAKDGASLRSLENQLKTLSKSGLDYSGNTKQLSEAIAFQKGKIAEMTAGLVEMGGAGLVPAKQRSQALEGVISKLTGESGKLGEMLEMLGPEGATAAAGIGAMGLAAAASVAGVLAVAGAIVYLESKLVSLGVQASEAKGDVTRSLEVLYGSQKEAEHTYKVLESLTGSIAISQERVMDLSDSLIKAGQVNGDAMVRSIETIGKAEAARKGAGKVLEDVITRATSSRMFSISRSELMQVGISYKELSKEVAKGIGTTTQEAELRLRTGGVRVKEGLEALGRVVDVKMGDIALKKFQTVGVQTQRLHDNFTRLFEDVDGSSLARLLMTVANTLDESSVSGAALRAMLQSAFKELSDAAEVAMPYVRDFFEFGVLLALKFYNALYPVRKAIQSIFGGDQQSSIDSFENTLITVANAVGLGFTAAGVSIAFMINNAGRLAEVMRVLLDAIPLVGPAVESARAVILAASAGVSNDNAKKSGKNLADGVAAGVVSGQPAIEQAMAQLAKSGVKAFDQQAQIHSPSKVMQLRGYYMTQGLAKGVNDNAQAPTAAMSQVANDVASAPATGTVSGGGVVVHVTFEAGAVVIGHGQQIADAEDQLTGLLANVLEKANKMVAGGN